MYYRLLQSTDAHAFDPVPLSLISATQLRSHSQQQKLVVGFSQTPAPTTGLTRQEIRDLSLKGVKTRAASTAGSGRLHGKVAIITGAGPELAIGVSAITFRGSVNVHTFAERMQTGAARLFAREGAKHIYLLDYNPAPLSRLAEALREKYPNTKASPNPMRHSRSTVDQDGVLDLVCPRRRCIPAGGVRAGGSSDTGGGPPRRILRERGDHTAAAEADWGRWGRDCRRAQGDGKEYGRYRGYRVHGGLENQHIEVGREDFGKSSVLVKSPAHQ